MYRIESFDALGNRLYTSISDTLHFRWDYEWHRREAGAGGRVVVHSTT